MGAVLEYRARLDESQAELRRMEARFVRIGNLRLAAGLLAAVVAWLAFGQQWISPWWLIPPLAAFVWLVVAHEKTVRRRRAAARSVRFFERGLERLEGRWHGKGQAGEEFRDAAHLYADDLDIFGKGSLFELLNTARTQAGERTLAGWLLAPAGVEEALARQQAVEELRERLDFRLALSLAGEDVRASTHPDGLSAWATGEKIPFARGTRPLALLVAALMCATLAAYFAGLLPLWPFLIALLVGLGWTMLAWPRIRAVTASMETPAKDLGLLSAILERIERESFQSPYLAAIGQSIRQDSQPASARIAMLQRLVRRLDWARNQVFAPIALLLLWHLHIAISVERWREKNRTNVAAWMDAAGRMEAIAALSGFRYEHPSDPFPDLRYENGLTATGLAHPLLAESAAVRNDVELGLDARLLIVSGSNMSGKSTLLRAVGLNTVLAWAGAPVRAHSFSVSRLRVGASIRIQDSLQDGKSRFYAEITRLREIARLAGGEPRLLFLIDEMLSGTNSHDRRIGAEAILKSLLDAGAIGLVTTHDLALAEMAASLPGRAVNVHFEDVLEDGELRFDYRLREGVVRRSNALDLMRGLGLIV